MIEPVEAVPATMRAALLLGRGGPEMLQVRDDVPVPTPGPGEVLVKVGACGMNNTDINTRVGWYSRSVTGATTGEGFAEAREDDATWGRAGWRSRASRARTRAAPSLPWAATPTPGSSVAEY